MVVDYSSFLLAYIASSSTLESRDQDLEFVTTDLVMFYDSTIWYLQQ